MVPRVDANDRQGDQDLREHAILHAAGGLDASSPPADSAWGLWLSQQHPRSHSRAPPSATTRHWAAGTCEVTGQAARGRATIVPWSRSAQNP